MELTFEALQSAKSTTWVPRATEYELYTANSWMELQINLRHSSFWISDSGNPSGHAGVESQDGTVVAASGHWCPRVWSLQLQASDVGVDCEMGEVLRGRGTIGGTPSGQRIARVSSMSIVMRFIYRTRESSIIIEDVTRWVECLGCEQTSKNAMSLMDGSVLDPASGW